MFLGSSGPDFPALLKGPDGDVLAEGRALASPGERIVNFKSDFVPLYPKGSPLEIARTHHGQEVHRFLGRVYLSDKTYMRLVNVEDELLPGAEDAYCGGMSFPAVLAPLSSRKKRGLFQRLFSKEEQPHSIQISALTSRQFEFQRATQTPLEEGARFRLTVEPPLPIPLDTEVEIVKAMLFGPTASYLCGFTALSQEAREQLQCYLICRTAELFKFH